MDWKDWNGKKIFVRTRNGKVYSGKIISVDDRSPPTIFITLIDKFNKNVMLVNSEIVEIKEEI